MRIVVALCLAAGIGAARPAAAGASHVPTAVAGTVDLSQWDFDADGPVRLSGEWKLTWGELIPPDQLTDREPPAFIVVPGSWNSTRVRAADLPGIGCATHSLTVTLPPGPREWSLDLGETLSASRLFVNGKLVLERGRPGRSRSEEVPGPEPGRVRFALEGTRLDLVLQISNHFHFEGGPVRAIRIGLPDQMERAFLQSAKIDYLLMGCAAVLCLFYAFLFAMRPSEKAHLFFAGLAFIILLRVFVTNWHVNDFLPWLSPASVLRLDYLTLFLAPPVYYAFLKALFPDDCPGVVLRGGVTFAAVGLTALLLPTWLFTHLRGPGEAVALMVTAASSVSVVRATWKGREGAWFVVGAVLVVSSVVVYDILYRERIIVGTRDLFPFSLFFFVSSLASVLGLRFGRAFRTSERLAESLRELNRDLEVRVVERTLELERLATTDSLTGLHNRRSLMNLAEAERARAVRHGQPLSALILDVDHFKRVNDQHGHATGDAALKALGSVLAAQVRSHDVVGRFGGEEFVVLVPGLDTAQAAAAAERLRTALAVTPVTSPGGTPIEMTVSIGVAALRPEETLERFLARADSALYAAKTAGRNRVALAGA